MAQKKTDGDFFSVFETPSKWSEKEVGQIVFVHTIRRSKLHTGLPFGLFQTVWKDRNFVPFSSVDQKKRLNLQYFSDI